MLKSEEEEEVLGADVVTHANSDHSPCSQQPLTTYLVRSAGPHKIRCLTRKCDRRHSPHFGSLSVSYYMHRDPSLSPVEPLGCGASHRRGSFERRLPDSGNYRTYSQSHSRQESVGRGARVAESGTLIPRGRAALVVIC